MRKAVGAVLYHYSESRNPESQHLFVQKGGCHGVNFRQTNPKARVPTSIKLVYLHIHGII